MYKVIRAFTDLQDNNRIYHTGDIYPAKGAKASEERIAELSSYKNKVGLPLISVVQKLNPDGEPEETPKKATRSRKKT